MRIVLIGPPAAGKHTQANILANQWHIPHISTGDMLHRAIAQKTTLAKAIQPHLASGELVPDQWITTLLQERLRQSDTRQGWILNGFPRTISQATILDRLLADSRQTCDWFIGFYVSVDVLMQRQPTLNRDPVLRRKLEVYYDQTLPLIQHYRHRNNFVLINGDRPVEAVTQFLNNSLRGLTPA